MAFLLLGNSEICQTQDSADADTSLIEQFHQEMDNLNKKVSRAFANAKVELEVTSSSRTGWRVAQSFDAPTEVIVWIEREKFRVSYIMYHEGDVFRNEGSFDGKAFYNGTPDLDDDGIPAKLTIRDPVNNADNINMDYLFSFKYLHYAGVHTPIYSPFSYMENAPYFGSRTEYLLKNGKNVEIFESNNTIVVKCEILDYPNLFRDHESIGVPVSENFVDSIIAELKNLQIVIPMRTIEIHLDPSYGFAPVFYSSHSGKAIARTVSFEDYSYNVEHDLWLPGIVAAKEEAGNSVGEAIYRLKRYEFGFSEHINYTLIDEYTKPATQVTDLTDPQAGYFYVDADGRLTKKEPEAGIAEIKRSDKSMYLLLPVVIIVLLCLAAYCWKKR